jgi:hypothetical protein
MRGPTARSGCCVPPGLPLLRAPAPRQWPLLDAPCDGPASRREPGARWALAALPGADPAPTQPHTTPLLTSSSCASASCARRWPGACEASHGRYLRQGRGGSSPITPRDTTGPSGRRGSCAGRAGGLGLAAISCQPRCAAHPWCSRLHRRMVYTPLVPKEGDCALAGGPCPSARGVPGRPAARRARGFSRASMRQRVIEWRTPFLYSARRRPSPASRPAD